MTRRTAFTLMEILVYIFVFCITGLLIASVFQAVKRTQSTTAAAYAVSGQTDTTIHWLRQDLQETALPSLQIYKGDNDTLSPTASMVAAREMSRGQDTQGRILVSEFGVPRWNKQVCYAIQRKSASDVTGSLVRWEVELPDTDKKNRLPVLLPLAQLQTVTRERRVLLRNVLGPGQSVNVGAGTKTADPIYGGFRMQYVRRLGHEGGTESMSDVNPRLNLTDAKNNTRLVEVELKIAEIPIVSSGRPNYYSIRFRVCPRH